MQISINTMVKKRHTLKAVVYSNAIYLEHEGKVYRHSIQNSTVKRHQSTGFISLIDLMRQRFEAVGVYEDDEIIIRL